MLEFLDILGRNIPFSSSDNSIHLVKVVPDSFDDFFVWIETSGLDNLDQHHRLDPQMMPKRSNWTG